MKRQLLVAQIRRRTYVVRIFPNTESCLRLVRALAIETHENWMEANRYINMDDFARAQETRTPSSRMTSTHDRPFCRT
ncbi:hypothetical protein CDO28_17850 [Sinorhizobium meliloti]|nr:hypothetical protein CDO28_17850 [Sinorhizobium meliloti]